MNEHPFTLSGQSYDLPHFATEIPIGLKFTEVSEGIVFWDFKWPGNMSHFACAGSIDPMLFKQTIRFRLRRPPYFNTARIPLSYLINHSSEAKLSGILYTEPQDPEKENVVFLPLEPVVKTGAIPWRVEVPPKEVAAFRAISQLDGTLNEIVISEEVIPFVESGDLEISIGTTEFRRLYDRNPAQVKTKIGFEMKGQRIYPTYPSTIEAGVPLIISFKNKSNSPVSNVSTTSTLRLHDTKV